jgi:hypothetical protein
MTQDETITAMLSAIRQLMHAPTPPRRRGIRILQISTERGAARAN